MLTRRFLRDPRDAVGEQGRITMKTSEAGGVAIRDLQHLGDPYGSLPIVQYQLAQVFLQEGNTTEAVAALNKALVTSHNYSDAILLLTTINLKAGKPQAVIDPMLNLLKPQPDLDRARVLLAGAYQALKQFDEAIDIFQKQILKHPNDAQSYFMLGMTYIEEGNLSEARTAIEKAQQLTPLDLLPSFQLVALDIATRDFNTARISVLPWDVATGDQGESQ
jgi:tetratricopeptide (TPR) repeat protein